MERGDHLVSPRFGYDHHGLYLGDNEVIHYSGFSDAFDKGSIEITSLENFEQDKGSRVEDHLCPIFDVDERINRAYSKLGEDSYNLLFNNCEHFVTWCIFGIHSSDQVNKRVAATVATAKVASDTPAIKILVNPEVASKTGQQGVNLAVQHLTKKVAANAIAKTIAPAASAALAPTLAPTAMVALAPAFAPAAVPVVVVAAVGVGLAYGVKSLVDWIWD
ncbi:lecithin retinol acyltransferase family protein [Aeromonas veronii]|uniref:Lecithin retinol acyltransferase family protein n=1 Tax=Aeromonas veronii TaxID=654 RepID=A0AAW5MGS7_AERVE|nr:lecithin retinol acyltransferase family protein [Aeromonas veronii]MBL0489556.1 lecithin retinol acyltransferase family protein [Aeromonas veronii]MCR4450764.1 lecithin retinol acyltransferase family protein [Aeromonas veronii]